MAHGKVALAWRAHPFGVVAFPLMAVLALLATAELASGRDLLGRLRPGLWWAWVLLGGLLVGWLINMAAGYLRGDYPLK